MRYAFFAAVLASVYWLQRKSYKPESYTYWQWCRLMENSTIPPPRKRF